MDAMVVVTQERGREMTEPEIVHNTTPMSYRETLEHLVRMFERQADRKGWGGEQEANAALGAVKLRGLGDGVVAFSVHMVDDFPDEFQGNFPEALDFLSHILLKTELNEAKDLPEEFISAASETLDENALEGGTGFLDSLVDTSFVGWITSMEAYSITSNDRNAERYSTLRRVNEHPDRVEQRIVHYSGIDRSQVVAMRNRGQGDDEVRVLWPTDSFKLEGRVPLILRRLNLASMMSVVRNHGRGARSPIATHFPGEATN